MAGLIFLDRAVDRVVDPRSGRHRFPHSTPEKSKSIVSNRRKCTRDTSLDHVSTMPVASPPRAFARKVSQSSVARFASNPGNRGVDDPLDPWESLLAKLPKLFQRSSSSSIRPEKKLKFFFHLFFDKLVLI